MDSHSNNSVSYCEVCVIKLCMATVIKGCSSDYTIMQCAIVCYGSCIIILQPLPPSPADSEPPPSYDSLNSIQPCHSLQHPGHQPSPPSPAAAQPVSTQEWATGSGEDVPEPVDDPPPPPYSPGLRNVLGINRQQQHEGIRAAMHGKQVQYTFPPQYSMKMYALLYARWCEKTTELKIYTNNSSLENIPIMPAAS